MSFSTKLLIIKIKLHNTKNIDLGFGLKKLDQQAGIGPKVCMFIT
jgi:hypothetical protein